ncbi:Ger(x)C family spore germination protein (plasmid) [Cytobacillus spongiae]|uniref:Ger(x)C family spore germination protein n=1 Tax=Cytobacillus spongiae TaxID=2901381 RepID=UPI001F476D78|nr:Ger(x)C family spore germination protein [Cytobacillus spongiae]UII58406.1 Ger(x)C family spore germination protein [Cytobacillus spongiae]
MKSRLLSVLITFSLILSGCWNSRELDDIGIAVALGFDKAGDEVLVSVQLVNPAEISSKHSSGNKAPIVVYQETGETVFEALRKMTKTVPLKTFFPHLRMLVIGEDLAKEGIATSMDLLARDQEFRTDFYVVIAKENEAQQILKMLVPVEKITAQNLFNKLETSSNVWAPTVALKIGTLIDEFISPGKQAVITGVKIIGHPEEGTPSANLQSADPPVRLQYTDLALFKEDKLKGWLTEAESKGYNYINGNVKSTIVTVPCSEKGSVAIEILKTKSKIKAHFTKGKPSIEILLKAMGNVGEVECGMNFEKSETIKYLEKQMQKDIKGKMQQSIKTAQETYHVDIFGFGEVIHRKRPSYWKDVKEQWDEHFDDLPVKVQVSAQIRQIGKRNHSVVNRSGE